MANQESGIIMQDILNYSIFDNTTLGYLNVLGYFFIGAAIVFCIQGAHFKPAETVG